MLSFKVWLFTQASFCGPQTAYTCGRMSKQEYQLTSPFLCCCQSKEAMEYNCSFSWHDQGTCHSGTSLGCEPCTSSGCQEVAWRFSSQLYSWECSLKMSRVHKYRIVKVCGCRPWRIAVCSFVPSSLLHLNSVDTGKDLAKEKYHLFCLVLLVLSPFVQCQENNRSGLQGWLAQTCHRE